MFNTLLRSREPRASINTPGCGWAAETKKVLEVFQTLSARALILQAIRPCAEKAVWFTRLILLVLGNISLDNILYRGNFLISKHRISIFIVFINFMYATHEVYSLDMSTIVI